MKKTVAIIGGAGFLGSYVAQKFLSEGYAVKVSTCDKLRPENYQHLHPDVVVSEMNVLDPAGVAEFISGCKIVVHTGTPFNFEENQDVGQGMFRPTIEGTQNVLQACLQAKGLQKLIVIATVAAINGYVPSFDPNKGPNHIFTIQDEPVSLPEHPSYNQAKHKADRLVREFIAAHPDLSFETVSLYPGLIIGRPISETRNSTSAGMLYLLKNRLMPNPMMEAVFKYNIEFAMVAVQDVAEAVYRASVLSGLNGKKYLISHETWGAEDIHRMLNGEEPTGTFRMQYSNQEAVDELGMTFTPARIPLQEYRMAPAEK